MTFTVTFVVTSAVMDQSEPCEVVSCGDCGAKCEMTLFKKFIMGFNKRRIALMWDKLRPVGGAVVGGRGVGWCCRRLKLFSAKLVPMDTR